MSDTAQSNTEPQVAEATRPHLGDFVAVNSISCQEAYRERFEQLFRSRAHAIDRAPGFRRMFVLRPDLAGGDYLVVSFWDDRASFDHWRGSPEFADGHRRGFEDIRQARERGEQPPMTSRMVTYEILTD